MAGVRLLGFGELEVDTEACKGKLSYDKIFGYCCVKAKIIDKRLGEEFTITAYADETSSRKKLEEIINSGVSDSDVKALRLIQNIQRRQTQAKYFEKYANNETTIKELEKVAKLSNAGKIGSDAVSEVRKSVIDKLTKVCRFNLYSWWNAKMLYTESRDYRFVLVMDTDDDDLIYAIVVNNLSTMLLDCVKYRQYRRYVEYAIYRYIKDGRQDLIRKWMKIGSENFSLILDLLNRNERDNTITIYNRELYDSIKAMIVMYTIA